MAEIGGGVEGEEVCPTLPLAPFIVLVAAVEEEGEEEEEVAKNGADRKLGNRPLRCHQTHRDRSQRPQIPVRFASRLQRRHARTGTGRDDISRL